MKMPVQHQAKVLFSVLAISLITVYQNCNSTRFQTENQVEAASTTADAEEDILTPTSTLPTQATLPSTPIVTSDPPSSGTYSYCQSKQFVVDCPDKRPNCKCTDTLEAGRYNSEVLVRGLITAVPNERGLYSMGPNCSIASESEYLSHSGTVTSLEYGTCLNYCSVGAYCIDGQWQNVWVTW